MAEPDKRMTWAVGKKTILCIGHNMIDYISIMKKFPRENAINRCIKGYWQRGGAASNNCTVLRNLGAKVEYFGVLSISGMFNILLEDMRKRGIITQNCPRITEDPPFSSVIITKSTKTRNIVNCNTSFPYVTIEDFRKLDLNNYGWIHFTANKPVETKQMMKDVVAHNATSNEKIIISLEFDKKFTEIWPLVEYCDYVIFSKRLAMQQNWNTPQQASLNIEDKLRLSLSHSLRPYFVFVWGSLGASYLDLSGNFFHAHAYKPKKMVDPLGAGDTFTAAFIYAIYFRERSVAVAVDFANRLASYKCTRYGYDHIVKILRKPAY